MIKNLFIILSFVFMALLSACGGSESSSAIQNHDTAASPLTFVIPEPIRTAQAVNLQATQAVAVTSAGTVPLTRTGDQFEGVITVTPGTVFTFTLSIFEIVDGQNIVYATRTESLPEPINQNYIVEMPIDSFRYPDDDNDGATNLEERNAGSNHRNSSSTPTNPDGITPTATNPGLLQFTSSVYSVAEQDGTLTISVNRSGGSDGRVSTRYNLRSETAILGRDFQGSANELIWLDGDTTPKEIVISVLTDDINDGDQTFTAHLFSPSGGASIGNGFARITLTDSTRPAQRGTIQLASNSASIDENAGQVLLEVERVGGSDGLVTVDFETAEGTAVAGDFTTISDPQTIRWGDGQDGTRTIRININNDAEIESAETFQVILSNNLGGAALGTATATITINDTTPIPEPDPDPVPGVISILESEYTVAEGGNLSIEVARQQGSDGAVSVGYVATAGTASAVTDFSVTSGPLNWPAGDNNPRFITINATLDTALEPDEQFTVTLQNPTSGATLGTAATTVIITDSTVALPGVLSFASTTTSVNEGETVQILVARTGGSDGPTSVSVTAAESDRYTVTPATLNWADGDNNPKTITIITASNEIAGDDGNITIELVDPSGGATLESNSLTITLNDTTVPVPLNYQAVATDGQWEVCIAPYNNSGPTAFATQASATEGRAVSCIKTCPETIMLDDEFAGWGWNPNDQHSCTASTDAPGTYTFAPIYTPSREVINTNLNAAVFTRGNMIWGCIKETRQNAEFNYIPDTSITVWYLFSDDGTYLYGNSTDGSQPAELQGPEVWSASGRVLELGHLNIGYRNTLFYPGNQTLHIHPTTDERLSCSRQNRATPVVIAPVVTPAVVLTDEQ